jgi:hypothetical protein
MKKKLISALSYIENGKGIELGNDTFLCGIELDGSDKVYGFARVDNELIVITRQCTDGYPIEDMDRNELTYMFKYSSIYTKILAREYGIVEKNEI